MFFHLVLFIALYLATLKQKMIILPVNSLFLVNLKPDVCLNYYSIISLRLTLALFYFGKKQWSIESVFGNDSLHIYYYF